MTVKIKEAKGGAPFWRHYINLGVGKCEVGCLFCYNNRWKWSKDEWRPHEFNGKIVFDFEDFEWIPGKCKQYEGQHDIMMCSVGDPFATQNSSIAMDVLELGRLYPNVGNHLRVLSKLDGSNFVNGWEGRRPNPKTMFGATICTLDEEVKKATMPYSADLVDVLGSYLYTAEKNYHPTFLSCEPMLKGMDLVDLMEELREHEIFDLNEIWIGKLNYGFGCEEFAMKDKEIIEQVRRLTDSYDMNIYLKREVRGSKMLRIEGLVKMEGTVYDKKRKRDQSE